MQELPLINLESALGAAMPDRTVQAIAGACRDTGFMYVRGHGIDATLIEWLRSEVVAYFSRSTDDKMHDVVSRDEYRGYIPQGYFTANSGAREADEYEGYKLHYEIDAEHPICGQCALYAPNKWPTDGAGLRSAVTAYWRECDRVAALLLTALAKSMDADVDQFLAHFDLPLTNMTLLHYPPQQRAKVGIHAHKDTDALTILAPDPVGGLQVRARRGKGWIDATPPADTLLVNIGDMMEAWSGGLFVSTPHRVINSSGIERYSFPYFSVPRFDVVVQPLIEPVTGFDRPNMHAGDVSRKIWYSNWPDAAPVDPSLDPAIP